MKVKQTIARLIKLCENVFFNDISAGQYHPSSGLFGDLTNLRNIYTHVLKYLRKILNDNVT